MNREELKRLWFSLDYSNVKEKKEIISVYLHKKFKKLFQKQ